MLTREFGRIDAVAKGARKAASRLAAVSEPLTHATFQIAEGRRQRFVTQAQPRTAFPGLRSDFERLSFGLALAELYAAVTHPGQVDPDLFDLLIVSLEVLASLPEPKAAMVWAELRLMEIEGVAASWTHCTARGTTLAENPAWVSPSAGGHLSAVAALEARDRFQAPAEVLIALDKTAMLEAPPPRIKRVDECLAVLHRFWLHHAHGPLPANKAMMEALELPKSPGPSPGR